MVTTEDEQGSEAETGAGERTSGSRHRFSALLAWCVVGLVVAWLLSITLRPGRAVNHIHLVPFSEKLTAFACMAARCPWSRSAFISLVIDLVGNVLVFVPFGAALALATLPGEKRKTAGRPGRRWWLAIFAAGFALSLGIELAQLTVPGRVTDIDDLILNVTGTLIGAAGIRFLDLALKTSRGIET